MTDTEDTATEHEQSDDPLADAEIGEVRRVETEQTFHSIDHTPEEFRGLDRRSDDYEPVAVELVEDGEMNNWRVTWEGTVEKREVPEYAEEASEEQSGSWRRNVISIISGLVPVALVIGVVSYVMPRALNDLTVNGQPVSTPTPESMAMTLLSMGLIAFLIILGIKYAPGYAGGRPR